MSPLAWLIGLALPACGFPAAQGLPTPPLMDVAHIVRPASPNTALAAPAGFSPAPDIVIPHFNVPAARLFATVRELAASEPRTYQAAVYPDQLQAHYVARSAVLNFPDLIMVQVQPDGPDASNVILYSRSVYGYSDFGVNRRRVEAWFTALQMKFPSLSER
ncbi:MAG: DUF1499 domain-containing protein [Rhodopila sp.]|nr:DUF1499 domain-containing protein [Rhodopila sp.]